jgi:energy-coupling factor transporter ATP-binding protein EcfA2
MVDLFGMFRRRPAKRGAPGFARSRDDITALGDSFGDMLTSPVRDAPSKARAASLPGLELPQPQPDVEPPREPRPRAQPRPKANGGDAPRQIKRPGFLAVHSVEKSFGTRQVVRGVSIYVRRGEAVGLLGPNGAGKTTVFYMITGLIKADRGAIELDGHDVTKLPMYQRARLGIGYLPQEASIFRGLTLEVGVLVGLGLVTAGIVVAGIAVRDWWSAGFGELDPQVTMRRTIPAVLLLTLGVQTFFASFFLGVLTLRRKRVQDPDQSQSNQNGFTSPPQPLLDKVGESVVRADRSGEASLAARRQSGHARLGILPGSHQRRFA